MADSKQNKTYLFLKVSPVYAVFSAVGSLMASIPLMYLYHRVVYLRCPPEPMEEVLLLVVAGIGLHWLVAAIKGALRW